MIVARYHRVSTEDQSFERQVNATDEYVDRNFDADEVIRFDDASTGTDTQRDGYREMMELADAGDIDAIVVKSMSRISRSNVDFQNIVERLKDVGVELHIIDHGFEIKPDDNDPMQKFFYQVMSAYAEMEAETIRKNVKEGIAARQREEDYHHGRPPLGYKSVGDGRITTKDNYDRVCATLQLVERDELSKRKAAEELETSRKSIRRALDKPDLYGLDQ